MNPKCAFSEAVSKQMNFKMHKAILILAIILFKRVYWDMLFFPFSSGMFNPVVSVCILSSCCGTVLLEVSYYQDKILREIFTCQ